jgi:hypothetical protein
MSPVSDEIGTASRRSSKAALVAGTQAPADFGAQSFFSAALSGTCAPYAIEAIDAERTRLARSAGALRLALGMGLECLARRGAHHELGFSSVKAYARERCEYSARAAQEARSLARRLEQLPQTRGALLSGQLSWSHAVLIARIATAEDEAHWLALARDHTVRQMRGMIQAHRSKENRNRAPDSDRDLAAAPERFRTLTVTVDAADAWTFECTRWMVARISGGVSDAQSSKPSSRREKPRSCRCCHATALRRSKRTPPTPHSGHGKQSARDGAKKRKNAANGTSANATRRPLIR